MEMVLFLIDSDLRISMLCRDGLEGDTQYTSGSTCMWSRSILKKSGTWIHPTLEKPRAKRQQKNATKKVGVHQRLKLHQRLAREDWDQRIWVLRATQNGAITHMAGKSPLKQWRFPWQNPLDFSMASTAWGWWPWKGPHFSQAFTNKVPLQL